MSRTIVVTHPAAVTADEIDRLMTALRRSVSRTHLAESSAERKEAFATLRNLSQRGWSAVEMMVVMVVLAILMAVAVPTFAGAQASAIRPVGPVPISGSCATSYDVGPC